MTTTCLCCPMATVLTMTILTIMMMIFRLAFRPALQMLGTEC